MKRILEIAMVLGLVGSITFIAGCSKKKAPQAKDEPTAGKVGSAPKESSGKEAVIDLGKDVKLELVLIPAGKFKMGSPASEKGRFNPASKIGSEVGDETQHEVTLTKPFYMGKFEVTQEQWETVMGNNPSSKTKGAKLPVTDVSWNDSKEFIKKLNASTKGNYRLPSEAEWEYACRAGTSTVYSFGDNLTNSDANINGGGIKAVGSYKPNAFGLYDMHGNVFEWCEDWYGDYPAGAITDPKGPAIEKCHISRGGAYTCTVLGVRSAYRNSDLGPTDRFGSFGFRLARTP
ncbi:MAG: formylglycine-generating enzyme family protein [Planctomycetota bacterium]|nr:formylglycine-generating enzyme family protein [Planctomycetota bacterium]